MAALPSDRAKTSNTEAEGPSDVEGLSPPSSSRRKTRRANIYDAVAGRVKSQQSSNGSRAPVGPDEDIHHPEKDLRLAPEDVLFKRRGAPPRFAEKDIYQAADDLPDRAMLPDSDLLKSAHAYASRYYDSAARRRPGRYLPPRAADDRSLDETALLAVGILLEEAAREALGRTGDLLFTEGVLVGADVDGEGKGKGKELAKETETLKLVVRPSDDKGYNKRGAFNHKRQKVGAPAQEQDGEGR